MCGVVLPTAGRTSRTYGCLPSSAFPATSVCIRFVRLTLADLHRVLAITAGLLATIPPLPSFPHAGIFASLTGKVVSEFPDSMWRCVLAPRSCLLYAGGSLEPFAHTALVVATSLVPFWLWRVSRFRHSIVTALQIQISCVSIGHRACPLSPFLARREGPLSVGFRP